MVTIGKRSQAEDVVTRKNNTAIYMGVLHTVTHAICNVHMDIKGTHSVFLQRIKMKEKKPAFN
jgi:hypothetical protein